MAMPAYTALLPIASSTATAVRLMPKTPPPPRPPDAHGRYCIQYIDAARCGKRCQHCNCMRYHAPDTRNIEVRNDRAVQPSLRIPGLASSSSLLRRSRDQDQDQDRAWAWARVERFGLETTLAHTGSQFSNEDPKPSWSVGPAPSPAVVQSQTGNSECF